MAPTDWPYGYGMLPPSGPPGVADLWLRGEYGYPAGRGARQQATGWLCPGCQRGLAPAVRECPHCGPQQPAAEDRGCGRPREGGMCACGEPDEPAR